MTFSTTDLTPLIGTEIHADVDTLLSGKHAAEIRDILERRGVFTVRRAFLTDEQQLAFAKTIGEIIPSGDKGIVKVSMDERKSQFANYMKGAIYWHIDGATDERPTRASVMGARKLSDVGGETEFANTYAAWDALPEEEKREYEKLRVIHSLEVVQRMVIPEPDYATVQQWQNHVERSHPLVWHHQSGRKSLVLGATASHIEGMDLREGRLLLARLRDWATQRQFVYQHRWTLGDLLVWDNTGTMHRVLPYPIESERMMHRITLTAEEPLV